MAAPVVESLGQFDRPVQSERDLRSANKEWKRGKDSSVKWSYGAKPQEKGWYPSFDVEDDSSFKARPAGKASDLWGQHDKDKGNINKYARTTGRIKEIGNRRVRSKVSAREELDEASSITPSIFSYLPISPRHQMSNPMDNVLYSFDRADSPGRPLTLEVFVKKTGRDTEQFVEKEYEILDANGDALKGRRARRHLRGGANSGARPTDEELEEDEDEFVLVPGE